MGFFELLLIAVGLAMDAFAVSLCTGLSLRTVGPRQFLTVGLYFGIFQAVMPLLGFVLGSTFADQIMAFDHWIVFLLLALIGGKMLKESFDDPDCDTAHEPSLGMREMLVLAVATSLDAFAVGITFSFLHVPILPAVTLIGVVTLMLSVTGVKIGNLFGVRFKAKAERFGGIVLILIGLNILLEHLEVIPI